MGSPSILLYVALAAYVPFTFACFAFLGGRRALLWSMLTGWLFLPWFNAFGRAIPLLHGRETFVPAWVLVASLLLDSKAWSGLRWRAFDLPILALTMGPFLTSISVGRGAYDGLSSAYESFLTWGAPYLLGRVYLGSPAGILDAARGVVAMGMASLPLVLWEVRMSPQLHRQIYGFHQHSFPQHVRDGHYRPMLFQHHGLMVGMLMTVAALVAWWLWRTRALERIGPFPLKWSAPALIVGAFLCRAAGAFALLVVGIVILEASRLVRTRALFVALLLAPATYCTLRIGGLDTAPILELADRWFGAERANSLRIRIVNEDRLVAHDLRRPLLGYGRWNDSRLRDEEGRDNTIVDSLWILMFGIAGLVGLSAAGLILALPQVAFLRSAPPQAWRVPDYAPVAALAICVGIWAIDALVNAMVTPVYPMLSGAILSFCARPAAARRRRPTAPPARAVRPPSPVAP